MASISACDLPRTLGNPPNPFREVHAHYTLIWRFGVKLGIFSHMLKPTHGELRLTPADPELRAAALQLVFSRVHGPDQPGYHRHFLSELQSDTTGRIGLWVAQRDGELRGAILWELLHGKSASLWPGRLVPGEPRATIAALLQVALQVIGKQPIRIVQSLLEPDAVEDGATLREAGFKFLAELMFLVCRATDFPRVRPESELEFEAYGPENQARLARAMEETYQGSLDCPLLDGLRDTPDVLEGYRATGVFDPGRWLIVRHQGADVGCLLLADHPAQDQCELIYMGLVPAARGRGWGAGIVRHAQWVTRSACRSRLILAVDSANRPALRMYTDAGFVCWDRRAVYAHPIIQAGPLHGG